MIPPSGLSGLRSEPGRHLFTASRLDGPKRIDLLIDAMRLVEGDVELRIAGVGPEAELLRSRAGSDRRIRFLGHVDDDRLADEYATALAVPFVPRDEDLGLITLEAQLSGKPVVTCTDSGGPTELVDDGVNGFVVAPEPRALASELQRLVDDPELAAAMGRRGLEQAGNITWAAVVDALLREPAPGRSPQAPSRPSVLVLSTYVADPPRHGGQIRLHRLLSRLADHADVQLLAVGPEDDGPIQVKPGFLQVSMLPGHGYFGLDHRLGEAVATPAADIAASLAWNDLGELTRRAQEEAARSDAVILAHPYLYPVIRDSPLRRLIYDAHNVETDLKRSMYETTEVGSALAAAVRDVEAAVLRSADLVTSVSDDDLNRLIEIAPTLADFRVVPNGGDVLDRDCIVGEARRRRRDGFLARLARHGIGSGIDSIALFLGSGHPPNVQAALHIVGIAEELHGRCSC